METVLLTNCRIAGGDVPTQIAISEGSIASSQGSLAVEADLKLDLNGAYVFPGFIDIHNHGAFGVDVNSATAIDLIKVGAFLAKNGVTAWMPTLVPDSDENYRRAVDAIDEVMERQIEMPVAQAIGVHYEGVFANEAMCGALRPQYFRNGQWSVDGGRLPKLDHGVHMTTLAPEIEGGIDVIEQLVADGWVCSIGHTKADVDTLERAFSAGARHLTHFFNAMTPIHHRNVGVAGWGLSNAQVTFDIIADGVHVHPKIVGLACRTKGTDKVSLISDSVAPTGLGDGEFELWGETITVVDGRTKNERGSIAGSVGTMLHGVKLMHSLGFSDSDVVRMASTNPARLIGIDSDRGSIEVCKRADLVAIDALGHVKMTMIGGNIVE